MRSISTDSERDYYGDPTHLSFFQTDRVSYEALLKAVTETLHERGILMPIFPDDVFGRHEFLGGVHCLRGLTSVERRSYYSSLLNAFLADEEEQEEVDAIVPGAHSAPRESFDKDDLFNLINEDNDPVDNAHLRQLKSFFTLAYRRGDMDQESREDEEGKRINLYSLRTGGMSEQPPVGQLVFFEQHKRQAANQNTPESKP